MTFGSGLERAWGRESGEHEKSIRRRRVTSVFKTSANPAGEAAGLECKALINPVQKAPRGGHAQMFQMFNQEGRSRLYVSEGQPWWGLGGGAKRREKV